MNIPAPTAIVAISSHVARGSVGNRAIVFALESLGFPVWSVPTVVLPWHPGHGAATRILPNDDEFGALLAHLSGLKFSHEVRAVISGYMGSVAQVKATAAFVARLRAGNPDLYYVCDPVIGDEGGLYVSTDIAEAIHEYLLPLADLITPNRFEFSWLMKADFATNDEMIAALRTSSSKRALITSAFPLLKAGTGNLYVDDATAILAEHRLMNEVPNGTGDLTAALFLARFLSGLKVDAALQLATQSVSELLQRTAKRGADELTLEMDVESLRRPTAMVQLRQLGSGIHVRRRPKD